MFSLFCKIINMRSISNDFFALPLMMLEPTNDDVQDDLEDDVAIAVWVVQANDVRYIAVAVHVV